MTHPFNVAMIGQGAIASMLGYFGALRAINWQVLTERKLSAVTVEASAGNQVQLVPQAANLEAATCLIVPLKAYQVLPALTQYRAQIPPNLPVVLLHNGIIPAAHIAAILPANPLFAATTRQGVLRLAPHQFRLTGAGITEAGCLQNADAEQSANVRLLLTALLPEFYWRDNIRQVLWDKLAINAIINPLTAIANIPNGELLSAAYTHDCWRLATEISAVMQLEGVARSADDIMAMVSQVATATAGNYSSMQQDVQHQRQTEIDYINGAVVAAAQRHQIAVPFNQQLVARIRGDTPPHC